MVLPTRFKIAIFTTIVGTLLGSCNASEVDQGPRANAVVYGHSYRVTELDGRRIADAGHPAVTVTFGRSGEITGTVFCNEVGNTGVFWSSDKSRRKGHFKHIGDGNWVSTAVGCVGVEIKPNSYAFWHKMKSAKSWSLLSDDFVIRFRDGSSAKLKPVAVDSR